MMNSDNDIKPVEVFSGTTLEAGMVKSMLESEGIEAFLQDLIMGTLNPWWTAPGGAGSVKVVVSSVDAEQAMIIVKAYENNLKRKNS